MEEGYSFSSFVTKLKSGFNCFLSSVRVFFKFPLLFLPLFFVWLFYSGAVIYYKYFLSWENISTQVILIRGFLFILFVCFVLSFGSFILLELIQQIETGKKLNFFSALKEVLTEDLIKAFPIMLLWAIIWFVIEIISCMLKKNNSRDNARGLSLENVSKTLSGYGNFSLLEQSLDLINSGVRMIVFFAYPAIAWENEGPIWALKKCFSGLKQHTTEFISGFISVEVVVTILSLPIAIIIFLVDNSIIELSAKAWVLIILYILFVSSLYLYLQQMTAAILYLWHMRWRMECVYARKDGLPEPKLTDVKKPDLLDNVQDLNIRRTRKV